jgi:predicted aspartyl protease
MKTVCGMIRAMRRMPIAALLLLLAVWPSVALAQIYRWMDERGTPHYVEGIDNVPAQFRATAMPLSMRNSPAPAAQTPGATAATGSAGTEIKFVPGKHIVVEARINDSPPVKLILDTGAAGTLISPRALAAAGVSLTRGARSARTRGVARDTEVEVQQVAVESLAVGDARVANLVVSSYEMDMPDAEGLLGQDFLGNFNVSIDAGSGVVKLTKK